MKKRIFRSMLILTLITLVFSSVMVISVLYRTFYSQMKQEIRNEAYFITAGYNQSGQVLFSTLSDDEYYSSRVTWIDSDGTVLFDNAAYAETMENHYDRVEFIDALKNGHGESVHLSSTLGTQQYYSAVLLDDGTVLRVSSSTDSVYKSIVGFIPYILLLSLPIVLLTMIIANLIAKKIIVPLNNLNLEDPLSNDTYDELSPLLSRMQKQNEQIENQYNKIRQKGDELNAIMENIGEGIIILNGKGQILSINKRASSIFETSSSESINKHILTIHRGIPLQKAVKSALGGKPCENTFEKGKSTLNILASPVEDGNPIKGVILLIIDITEKQAAEKTRREFSANVSHELKTPLTSILGYAEMLKNGMVKNEDVVLFSERIHKEAMHLITLVEDIIELSKLDEKNVRLRFENINLLDLVKDVVNRLSPLSQEKQIKVSVTGKDAIVNGVEQILEEMIYNLCDNAIKYNKEQGTVTVDITDLNDEVILTVKDDGLGIPKEHQSRIFERFYRVDKSHSRHTGGTGLGLSIVKHGAEFHNAKIKLESEQGEGTNIVVTFDMVKK